MSLTVEKLQATEQLERARETLGHALGLTQDIGSSGLDVGMVSASLASSVKEIFKLKNDGLTAPDSVGYIHSAMNHLRQTLVLLQEVRDADPVLEQTTSTVARTLALLYPISKLLEELAKQPKAPLPLTKKPPKKIPPPVPHKERAKTVRSPKREARERRTSERRIIEVDIGIQSATNFFTGFTQDISSGGLFVSTFDILAIGTPLNINFRLPGGPVLSLNGTVRWIREYNETNPEMEPGMGIRFEELNSRDAEAINEFMAQNPPIFYEDN
jgi:uncharacterized protein (TIGR02266 family)